MTYKFKKIDLDDMASIQGLFEDVYGVGFKEEGDIKQKYIKKDGSLSCLGYLAITENTGEIAGMYMILREDLKAGSRIIKAAQSADTMTHPKHQGKGLFIMLANKTYELAEKEGVEVVFGFPNENSYHGFSKKLGWDFASNQYTARLMLINPFGQNNSVKLQSARKGRSDLPVYEFGRNRMPRVDIDAISEYEANDFICWYKISSGYIEIGDFKKLTVRVSVKEKLLFVFFILSLMFKYNLKGLRFYGDKESLINAKKILPLLYLKESGTYGYKVFDESVSLKDAMKKMRFTYVDYDTF